MPGEPPNNVVRLPVRYRGRLTKRQLARHLRRSTRWVELMMRDEGLPFTRDERGWALFDLEEVERWLRNRT